jgi:hypothetical protein
LLREWPELGAFGVEWVRKWLNLRERLVEIAKDTAQISVDG